LAAGNVAAAREWCDRTSALLIVDESDDGFGRTGKMFASEHESVIADIVVLGKGLTGGYLPLAMTLVQQKKFLHASTVRWAKERHSLTDTATPETRSAARPRKRAVEVFEKESVLEKLQPKIEQLSAGLRETARVAGGE